MEKGRGKWSENNETVEEREGTCEREEEMKRTDRRREEATRAWKWRMVNEGRIRRREDKRRGWNTMKDGSGGERAEVGGGKRLEL